MYRSFCKKWYNDTAVSFGFLNTRIIFLLKTVSGKCSGSECECRVRALGYMAISSGVARSILPRVWQLTSSIGPVATSTLSMLVNQWVPQIETNQYCKNCWRDSSISYHCSYSLLVIIQTKSIYLHPLRVHIYIHYEYIFTSITSIYLHSYRVYIHIQYEYIYIHYEYVFTFITSIYLHSLRVYINIHYEYIFTSITRNIYIHYEYIFTFITSIYVHSLRVYI